MNYKLYFAALLFSPLCMSAQTDSLLTEKKPHRITYGRDVSVDQKEATVAASFITSEKLAHRKETNPRNALYGLIPGLEVLQNQGAAWETTGRLFVRGNGTLSKKAPLVLVDGFERELGQLSMDEIESITVLKDAASTALYGMRGANGVIAVKTKRGMNGAPKIKFSYELNMATPFRKPKFVDGHTYAMALNEGMQNDGLAPRYDASELSAFKDGSLPDAYPNVDWWGESLRNHSFGNNVTFSVTGGGKFVRYFTQLNYLNDSGILRPVNDNQGYSTQLKYSKLNIRTNLDIELGRNTMLQLNMFGTFSEHNRPNATISDIFTALYKVPAGAFPIKNARGIWAGTTDIETNPVAMISGTGYARSQQRNFFADLKLTHRLDFLLKGLSVGLQLGLDNNASYWDGNARKYGYEQSTYDWASRSYTYKNLRNETALSASHSVGASNNHFNFNAFANFQRDWGLHSLAATAQYRMDKLIAKGQNTSYAFIDIVSQLHYAYKHRYLFDVSLSESASSILDPKSRWGVFPAAGIGWIVSEETFAKRDWLDFLKLRASYGISGGADYDNDLFIDMYGNGGSFFFGKNPLKHNGLRLTQLGISNLTYEKSHKLNIGFDFRAFKHLDVTVDFFYDHRTDILVDANGKVSSLFGLPVPKENSGVVDNRGIETSIRWNKSLKDFHYALGSTFSFIRNKIVNQNEEYRPYGYLQRTGKRIGQYFGYVVEGIYQNQNEIDQRNVKQTLSQVKPGDLKYKDLNNDGIIDSYDQKALGYSAFPEIYYSFDLNLDYKGWGLYAMFQGIGNVSVMGNTPSVYHPLFGNRTISKEYYDNRWTPETPNARYPRLTSVGSVNNYANNSLWIKNGAYFKLRTLEVYYHFKKHQLKPLKYVNAAKVYVRAYDLFSLDHIKVMDPENMKTGHPSMTRYAVGFDLKF